MMPEQIFCDRTICCRKEPDIPQRDFDAAFARLVELQGD
jgi:hypothetical protein